MNAVIDSNQALLSRVKAAEASGKKVPKAIQERAKKKMSEASTALQNCASDTDVQSAFQRLK